MAILENDVLKVQAKAAGAELTSIILKKEHIEYLWQADPKVWARHAPVLFPIVGKLHDNSYTLNGKEYKLSQHGFARDREFQVVESSSSHVVYRLLDDEKTREVYPYAFELDIAYRIAGNALEVRYKVRNPDTQKIYFSIGAHPGFNCPLLPGEKMEDYDLEFEKSETLEKWGLKDGLITHSEPFLANSKTVPLSKNLFKDDAIILRHFASDSLTMKSRKSKREITVRFPGFPYLGIWSKPSGAPFVCIEPWFGVSDFQKGKTAFTEKEGICSLDPGEVFECCYTLTMK